MNPHLSHKLKRIKIVKNFEIVYCDTCSLFATHPEIERPCKDKPDLLAELKRPESFERERLGLKSAETTHDVFV